MKLQAVTIDGTVIEADQFQSESKGIKLKQQSSGGGGSSETIGFVPFDRLMYVIPEDVTHKVENLEELPT